MIFLIAPVTSLNNEPPKSKLELSSLSWSDLEDTLIISDVVGSDLEVIRGVLFKLHFFEGDKIVLSRSGELLVSYRQSAREMVGAINFNISKVDFSFKDESGTRCDMYSSSQLWSDFVNSYTEWWFQDDVWSHINSDSGISFSIIFGWFVNSSASDSENFSVQLVECLFA